MKFPSLYEATEAFRKFMADHGCITHDQIVPTKETSYLHAVGDKQNEKKIAYTFHYDQNISGGFIRYNVDDAWRNWCYFKDPNLIEMTEQEKAAQKRQIEEAKEKQKEQKLALEAEKREKLQIATKAYEEGQAVPDSFPYFQNKKLPISQATFFKGFEPRLCYDPFFNEEAVYIPFFKYNILDFRQVLSGFERIFKDGSKRTIGYKNGAASFIDAPFKTTQMQDAYYVAEGFSTALAIHLATGKGVISVNGQGNLKKYRTHGIFERNEAKFATIIASDDDKYPDKDGKITNPGQQAAREAAGINVFKLAKPYFPEELETWASQQTPPIKLTDFADVFKYLGKEETKNQLLKAETVKMTDTPKQELIEYGFYEKYEPASGIEAVKHAFEKGIELNVKTAINKKRYANVKEYLNTCGFSVFKSQFNECFVEIFKNLKGFYGLYCISPNSPELKKFKNMVKAEFDQIYTDFIGDVALEQLMAYLSYEAEYKPVEVYNRIAKHEDAYYINLAIEYTKKAIKITKNEISFVENSPVFFVTSFNAKPFTFPDLTANIDFLKTEFRNICKVSDDEFWFLVAFIIDCWMPETSYQFLMITGEEGTSKSTLQKMIVDIIDPNVVKIVKLNQDNLLVPIIVSTKRHLLSYDNESELQNDSQDNFCAITTGSGTEARALYTNSDVHSIVSKSPIIMNGLYDFVDRPDLKSRTIHIKAILSDNPNEKKHAREYDDEVSRRWNTIKSKVVGSLLNLFQQCIIKSEEVKNTFPAKTRQATYLRLLHCIGLIIGDKDLSNRFLKSGQEDSLELILSEPVAVTIMNIGNKALDYKMLSAEDLLIELKNSYSYDPIIQKMGTKSLGWNIKRLTPSLRNAGFKITKTYLGGKYDKKLHYKIESPRLAVEGVEQICKNQLISKEYDLETEIKC